MSLEGKVAMVTGGAGGIGRGISRCLAAAGAKVAISDLDAAGARDAAAALSKDIKGAKAIGIEADAANVASTTAAIATIQAELGRLDIVVNNAGVGGPDVTFPEVTSGLPPILGMSEDDWDDQLRTNLRTAFATSKAVIPHIADGGNIINIASIAALRPAIELPAYGAAKAGVVHLTTTLAMQLSPRRIRVNAICPGLLWTRAWEILGTALKQLNPDYSTLTARQVFEAIVAMRTPLQEEQTPEDIGNLVVFLASELGRNITGQVIAVDGGITLGPPIAPPAGAT